MKNQNVQLVLPQPLHQTYKPRQQEWLLSLQEFMGIVSGRQV